MSNMITALSAQDIQKLNDTDLRILVEKLCRAELHRHGLPVSGVTAGGHQTAPDGGIDVRVEASQASTLDFIQRPLTGFQVKCSDMPPAKIQKEMEKKKTAGSLKDSIESILIAGGAYIIVCSQGSVADASLQDRKNAMKNAASGTPIHPHAVLDFYDAKRLADWAGFYPGVEHWVRACIGRPLEGWQAHCAWTRHADNDAFCLDDQQRVVHRTASSSNPQPILQALASMAQVLHQPGGVVRLIGLSGTGKTRLVEAIFDSSVYADALDSTVALYTDQGDAPNPTAKTMLAHLGMNHIRAVVVVDNCPPKTHSDLVEIVRKYPHYLSLITVEFDVATKEDEPDKTEVFELLPSSLNVLTSILKRHAPHVADTERRRIAELSDGNARVALALIKTLAKGETLGMLNDSAVFDRLFHQGRAEDHVLLQAAQVCALVYSFDVESEGEASHVNALAQLAGLTPPQLFAMIATLKSRDLVQSRSKWRAVLPHALANRLAKQALQHLQPGRIEQALAKDEHLLKSFGRRLSYLHDSKEAAQLAERWFADPSWLGKPDQLSLIGMSLFQHLASVTPALALATLEKTSQKEGTAFLSSGAHWTDWPKLLRHLAHDAASFQTAALLMHAVCIQSDDKSRLDSWLEMFGMYLSGTMATVEQRLAVVHHLLASPDATARQHAVEALGVMLKTGNFQTNHDFRFGSRPERMGWVPATVDEQMHWFQSVLITVKQQATLSEDIRHLLKPVLAPRLGDLLRHLPDDQEVPALVNVLADADGWPGAWVALNKHLRWHGEPHAPERLAALKEIQKLVEPGNLAQRIRAHVLTDRWRLRQTTETREEAESGSNDPFMRVVGTAQKLGEEAASNLTVLKQMLPEFVTNTVQDLQREFADSFAGALPLDHVDLMWCDIVQAFSEAPITQRNDAMLQGFLTGAAKVRPEWVCSVLDESVSHPALGMSFPSLQHCHLDDRCAERLKRWIDRGHKNIRSLEIFSQTLLKDPRWGPAIARDVFLQVAQKKHGHDVAMMSLMDMLWSLPRDADMPTELLELGTYLLSSLQFDNPTQNYPFKVATIAKRCLQQAESAELAKHLCRQLVSAGKNQVPGLWHYAELAEILLQSQPEIALDALVGSPVSVLGGTLLRSMSIHGDRSNPINAVPVEALKKWVAQEPSTRAPLIAKDIQLQGGSPNPTQGLSEIAEYLLDVTETSQAVLEGFESQFHPVIYVGSITQMLSPYLRLTQQLTNSPNTTLATWAVEQTAKLQARMSNDWLATRREDERFE